MWSRRELFETAARFASAIGAGVLGATAFVAIVDSGVTEADHPKPLHGPFAVDGHQVYVSFTAGMTVIVANPHPAFVHRGYVSSGPHHTEHWFAGATSPAYLAEKFLRKTWSRTRAITELQERAIDADAGLVADLAEAVEMLQEFDGDDGQSLAFLIDAVDCTEGVPGDGYDPTEVAWLAKVQAAYRARYFEGSDRTEASR